MTPRKKVEIAQDLYMSTRRGHFNIIHRETGFKADVYLCGDDELHEWVFGNRIQFEFKGETFPLAPPEYVILRKLECYREGKSDKHIMDIKGIIF